MRLGCWLYLGYLAVFFGAWMVTGVDYTRIGEDLETIRLWYAIPTLLGSVALAAATSVLGWWRIAVFDPVRVGPAWVWIFPAVMALVIANNVLVTPLGEMSAGLILWLLLGALGVGFGEEMATRGALLVGLRSRYREGVVWLLSTTAFAALHVPNVIFGLPPAQMPVQVILTFVIGTGFYAVRRVSGTLIVPMVLHGLWDSSLFACAATGAPLSAVQFVVYPVAVACAIPVVVRSWNQRLAS